MSEPFGVIYALLVRRHLRAIASKYHALIRKVVEEQLETEPEVQTRNRKLLTRPLFDATWELRFGPEDRFRVLYKVDPDERRVHILAIGEKRGERLRVGGEEIRL